MNREKYLIWQYRSKPKAQQTVGLLFYESGKTFKSTVQLADILNIDKSIKYGLDLVGRHVGISRTMKEFVPKDYFGFLGFDGSQAFAKGTFYRSGNSLSNSSNLDDESYRFLIKAKALKNYQTPDLSGISYSVRHLLGQQSFVIDNYDMTMNIVISETELTEFRLHAILKLDILVRPIGVRYKFIIVTSDKPFGWANDQYSFGFNQGTFTRLINANN